MRIIISPAKKMNIDIDSLPYESMPEFLELSKILQQRLQAMSYTELKALWSCNDNLAKLNFDRLRSLSLESNLTPAILSYEGIQYQHMAPNIFEYRHFDYIKEHLRILSGFYGILKPFDGVVPYRLELGAKLSIDNMSNLYEFWGDKLSKTIERETDFILNLASKEYSKAVLPYIGNNTMVITCSFGEEIDGKLIEKGTMCKMARGEMVRYLAEKNITTPNEIKMFNILGYEFSEGLSTKDKYVFIKSKQRKQ